eukprot:XP_023977512.1 beta-defensin 133 [Physeter catodon]
MVPGVNHKERTCDLTKNKVPVKCAMKDTYSCFIKRGKCRHVCHDFETPVGFCTKLNANGCM